MVRKKYKNEGLMKFLTIIGGLLGILLPLLAISGVYHGLWAYTVPGVDAVIAAIVAVIFSLLALLAGMRPGDPIPFNWLVLFILAILMFVFGASIGALLVIIAALIGLIEDL